MELLLTLVIGETVVLEELVAEARGSSLMIESCGLVINEVHPRLPLAVTPTLYNKKIR